MDRRGRRVTLSAMSWLRAGREDRGPIVAMTRGVNGAWVLADGGPETHVIFVPLVGDPEHRHSVRRSLTCVRAYDDDSVYAAGPGSVLVGYGGRWDDDELPAHSVRAIWCADHIYVLADRELLYFNGRWRTVELDVVGLDGDWAAGDGVGADNLIVGTNGTHSCIATGSGARWTREGCSSFYLYHARVTPTGAFALGGDGLWSRKRGEWIEHAAYDDRRNVLRMPLALDVVRDAPFVIAATTFNRSSVRISTFDGTWHVRPSPPETRVHAIVACRMPDGSLLAGDRAGALWRSTPG